MRKSIFLAIAIFTLAITAFAGPAISRGELLLQINGDECIRRAQAAFQAEGFTATLQGANLYLGQKTIHSAYIMCNAAPDAKTWVNIVVASDAGDGAIPGAERVKLEIRMGRQGVSQPQLVASCWRWTVEMKDGTRHESLLRMSSDGKLFLEKWGLRGTWTNQGSSYFFDWGRGAGKQDSLTLSGTTLSGSNFETNWIRGDVIKCP